jgi:hypothetical protein
VTERGALEPAAQDSESAPLWEAEFAEARSRSRSYTNSDFVKITRSFNATDNLVGKKQAAFRHSVEKLAWFYKAGKTENDPLLKSLSERKRHLDEGLLQKLRAARRAWVKATGNHYTAHEISRASDALVKQLPDFEDPEVLSLDGRSSTVHRQLRNIAKNIDLACTIAEKAVARVDLEIEADGRRGSKRSDEALHEFVRSLWDLYDEIAAEPKKPKNPQRADGGQVPGEFLCFLDACLRPVEIRPPEEDARTWGSLYQLYHRAHAPATS